MKRILTILLILAGVGNPALADTCGVSLTGVFTSFQANKLCSVFGSAVNHSLIPSTDNTYDLGSTSYSWRTLYTATSRVAKTSDILQVRQDAQRLFTWDASSDTVFTQKFGDGGTTAAQTLDISASTADADDDSVVGIGGGGSALSSGQTRGGFCQFSGNESVTTGRIDCQGGNVSGANVNILTRAASTSINLGINATTIESIDSTGAQFPVSGTSIAIQEATPSTACMGTATPNGTSNVTVTTSCAVSGSRVFYSHTGAVANLGNLSTTTAPNGTSFTFASSNASDNVASSVIWFIIKEAA